MKRVIVHDDLREVQIRPDSGFTTYIDMLLQEFEAFLAQAEMVDLSACPACGNPETEPDFVKMGVSYVTCTRCRTSYATPRPAMADLDHFYAQSEALRYWYGEVVQSTAPARRQFILNPRATWVLETGSLHGQDRGQLLDFNTKYPGYLEELKERGRFGGFQIRKPLVDLGAMLVDGTCQLVEAVPDESVNVISAFEVVERLFDPFSFLQDLFRQLQPGGLVFLTTSSISGFDLQILRQRARNLLPPTHLTLLSYQGAQALLERSGFEMLELSTPGQLDVTLVLDAMQRDPEIRLPPVIDAILLRRGEAVQQAFQDFLQRANLSSHVWITARKPA